MTKERRKAGVETVEILRNWTKDQKAAERLASSILRIENYTDIDPSHPEGGPDGKKDLICKKGNLKFIVAVYFSVTSQSISVVKKKFQTDTLGITKNGVDGIVFFTNQKITNKERESLRKTTSYKTEIYHLERIASILNTPIGYGLRLEFLDILLDKSEQLSYFVEKDKEILDLKEKLSEILSELREGKNLTSDNIFLFKETLELILGDTNPLYYYGTSMIDKLYVPVNELNEFREILFDIIGEYNLTGPSKIEKLFIPLNDIIAYNKQLEETIEKLKEVEEIRSRVENE